MNNLRRFEFYPNPLRNPYIEELFEYNVSDTEGLIHFNGHYYVQMEELPVRCFFNTYVREEKPYNVEGNSSSYRILEEDFYEVEIYDIEKIVNTSSYDEVDDEDGSKMKICYFPSHEQKIKFKIINKFNSDKELFKRLNEFIETQQKDN
jgi:hypothetical protein